MELAIQAFRVMNAKEILKKLGAQDARSVAGMDLLKQNVQCVQNKENAGCALRIRLCSHDTGIYVLMYGYEGKL